MKTLVIHPIDRSTDCLCEIYKDHGFDVIRESKYPIIGVLPEYDRIIMLGHGSSMGLFSVGRFPGSFAIDHRHVEFLENKSNIYIWCHASVFVKQYNLKGFTSGMFISEVMEAAFYGIKVAQEIVTESNDNFSKLMGQHIDRPWEVIEKYTSPNHEIVQFNQKRLEYVMD